MVHKNVLGNSTLNMHVNKTVQWGGGHDIFHMFEGGP